MVLHLFGVPPAPDAKNQTSMRELIDGRNLFRHRDRIPLDRQADATAKLDRRGRGGRGHERHKEIVRVPVLLGEISSTREGGAATGGDMGMLGVPHGFKAPLFTGPRQLVGPEGIIGGKHLNAEFHGVLLRVEYSAPVMTSCTGKVNENRLFFVDHGGEFGEKLGSSAAFVIP